MLKISTNYMDLQIQNMPVENKYRRRLNLNCLTTKDFLEVMELGTKLSRARNFARPLYEFVHSTKAIAKFAPSATQSNPKGRKTIVFFHYAWFTYWCKL